VHSILSQGSTTEAETQVEKPAITSPVMARQYDPVKNISKKKETRRLGVIIDDMWIVYKGETEDHLQLLVCDVKV
jgi:hypothetical protein